MIIKPTFLDHWKTRSLCTKLNDPLAPIYLIRLWGYCEASGKGSLDVPPFAVAAICQYQGNAEGFLATLVECGFVDKDGDSYCVHEWESYNAGLLTARANGAKGGRPAKTQRLPSGNPRVITPDAENPAVTHGLTEENPRDTQGLPTGNRPVNPNEPGGNPAANRLDRIGVDKIREEEENAPLPPLEGGNGVDDSSNVETPSKRIQWTPESDWIGITEDDIQRWSEAYPACDVQRQLKAAAEWLRSHPERAKKKAWMRFITGWLSREQDRGGDMRGGVNNPRPVTPTQDRPLSTWAIKERLKACETELTDLIYPGGCAFSVELTGKKLEREKHLRSTIGELKAQLTAMPERQAATA